MIDDKFSGVYNETVTKSQIMKLERGRAMGAISVPSSMM